MCNNYKNGNIQRDQIGVLEGRIRCFTQWGQVLESWNKKEEKRSENFVKDL